MDKRSCKLWFPLFLIGMGFLFSPMEANAQNLPLNLPVLQDYLRRQQLIDSANNTVSFNVRPLFVLNSFGANYSSPFLSDFSGSDGEDPSSGFYSFSLMPLQLTHVFNSSYPYGWGNGAIVPAKGQQILASIGAYFKAGPLSIQLYPQFHYAGNLPFEEYPENAPEAFFKRLRRGIHGIDIPVRHGTKPIKQFLPGNSHAKLLFGSFAAGVSTENFWWGPSQYNALLIGDNAQGFGHITLHTTKPVKTFIGHFEGQYFMGKLEGSGLPYYSDSAHLEISLPPKESDWRYFTGLTISYSPKWLPGLSLGGSRTFQVYRNDMGNNLRAWIPLFAPFPKEGEGLVENHDLREDQNISVYFRWSMPRIRAEFYSEYVRNDHALNWRDAILNPEHSRGYIMGFSKYFPVENNTFIEIKGEFIQTQNSINNLIRWPGGTNIGLGIYDNYQVRHGLTHKGQVIGPGTGSSGNLQVFEISRIRQYQKIGVQFERFAREQNFYQNANSNEVPVRPWVDFVFGLKFEERYNNLLVHAHIRGIKSFNYNFYAPHINSFDVTPRGVGRSNFNSTVKIAYVF